MSLFTQFIQSIINMFGGAIGALLLLLPTSPFTWDLSGASSLTVWLFWLFPIPGMITSIGAYVSAVALYYVIRVALRWIKVAGG
jgi:hypothetical protein